MPNTPASRLLLIGLLGRTLYWVGELEQWTNVTITLLGPPGTGKTSLDEVYRKFYQEHRIMVIPNNIEPRFGFQELVGGTAKLRWSGDDWNRKCSVDAKSLGKLMDGANQKIAKKNHEATVGTCRRC